MTNLAVIGAGVGGCSAAYFANKYLPGVNVTLYDAQNRIGGRILSYNEKGTSIELGASFFNSFNRTILGIVKAERLKITPVKESRDFAIWNGSEIIFKSGKKSPTLKLLLKYNLSLIRAALLLRKIKGQVNNLYNRETKNHMEIGTLFEDTNLNNYFEKSFLEILIEKGVSQRFIDEIITPITRTIYSQNADMGGFAGISSLIGVYSKAIYSLEGGNSVLPAYLADVSKADIKLGQKVDKIEKTNMGTYKVYVGEKKTDFDSVIIAAPLEFGNIHFEGFSLPNLEPQPYQTVYKKIIRGRFNPDYFGWKKSTPPPAMILTTKDADPITHYSIQKIGNADHLVTISSTAPLSQKSINSIFFDEGVTILEHCWKSAYPKFKPITKLPPTLLDKRLVYASAVEPAVASMETSMLSALNAIRLLS